MQDYGQLKADALIKMEDFIKVFVAKTKMQILESTDFINLDMSNLVPKTEEVDVFIQSLQKLNEHRCTELH